MSRLHVKELKVSTKAGRTLVPSLNIDIEKGEWFSIIGESGSGKSVSAFAITDMLPGGLRRTAAEISLDDRDLLSISPNNIRRVRGAEISYVFQDYSGAFTPFLKIGSQMIETIRAHKNYSRSEEMQLVNTSLAEVGLDVAFAQHYPFQLSGGQLQRAALATAMMLKPKLLIADEPTTALDAVSQAAVLDLINALREKHDCSVLFITHDLRCVIQHADRVAVMRQGIVVEQGDTATIVAHPEHPYTRHLFASVPTLHSHLKRLPVDDQL